MAVPRRILTCWFGDAPMNENRRAGIESLQRVSGVEVVLITEEDLDGWVVPERPLHPAVPLLTPIQRADYLGAYLMHVHGGGYADVKPTTGDWNPTFDLLDTTDLWGAGYQEVGRWGVGKLGLDLRRRRWQPENPTWWKYRFLQLNYRRLLGNCAYVFKPGTEFTRRWLDELDRRLDALHDQLRENPGRQPKERAGRVYDGVVSHYPVTWSHLHADVFQPLTLRYHRRLAKTVPLPVLVEYQ